MRRRKRDARCGKKGRNKTPTPDALGCCLRSGATSLGHKIMIASPVAKKIPDSTVLPKLHDEGRQILSK